MENLTEEADSNDSLTVYPDISSVQHRYVTSAVLIPLSLIIVAILSIDIIVLNKCKRIPFQVVWLSNMFLVASLLSDLSIIVMSIVHLTIDPIYTYVIIYSRVILAGSFMHSGWGGSALLAIERILALGWPFRYSSFVKKSRLKLLIVISWVLTFLIPCVGTFANMFYRCGSYLAECIMYDVLKPTRYYVFVTISAYLIFNIVAYLILSKILRRHLLAIHMNSADTTLTISKSDTSTPDKEDRAKKKLATLTKTISSVILTFICLHFLPLLHTLAFDIIPGVRTQQWETIFTCLSYFATSANAFMCSYMYIWRLQECKMMFLKTFMSWNKTYREEAERLRLSVYDIVTHDKSSRSN